MLGVDPGVMGTGWALLGEKPRLIMSGTITARHPDAPWLQRLEFVTRAFDALLDSLMPDGVTMECPAFFGGSTGLMVAQTGSLTKLAMMTGALIACVQPRTIAFKMGTPSEWKGQLPKSVTWDRCKKILDYYGNHERTTSHARDAVGIALWGLGRFE